MTVAGILRALPLAFFEGSRWYNLTSFVLTIIGFIAAIWQAVKARRAAEAARTAAIEAKEQVGRVRALVDLSATCGHIKEMLASISNGDFGSAATRIVDIRAAIAQLRSSESGKKLCSSDS